MSRVNKNGGLSEIKSGNNGYRGGVGVNSNQGFGLNRNESNMSGQ